MEKEGFKDDFHFETIVETEHGPVSSAMRITLWKLDHDLLALMTSIDCGTEGVKEIGIRFGISNSTRLPTFDLYVCDPETNKEEILASGDIDINNGYELIPSK